uniref:Geranylgeranylglyceryl phosphate synthase n=1 Tax=Ignisphaera aggregans TaxID=334771 RepID=A0A7C2VE26_9CREN
MKWRGKVYSYIADAINKGEKLHFTLVDPEKIRDLDQLRSTLKQLVDAGTDAIMIGGSLQVYLDEVTAIAKVIEELGKPSIIFPGSVAMVSPYADAILFISLLNSENPYHIIGAQVIAAPIIKKYGLEVLPTGYIVVGSLNTSVSFMGRARPVPRNKPAIAAAHALAAKYMGMKFVYLEAGSGAKKCVPPQMVALVKKAVEETFVIVGGGIRDPEKAVALTNAGADIIVTGTIVEKDINKAVAIVSKIKHR